MPRVERLGAAAVVTLDNPPAHVFSAAILCELADILAALEADPELGALVLAGQAARQSPVALAASKTLIQADHADGLDAALARERDAFGDLFAASEAAEGVAAFLEKREPIWSHSRSRST